MPLPHAKKNAFVEFSCRFSGTKISYCPRHLSVAKQVIFRTFELNSRLRIIAILDVKLKFTTLRSLLAAFDKLYVAATLTNYTSLQVNCFQMHLFLHQLTHNMTKDLFNEL